MRSRQGLLKGKRVLITSGPTREHLDPIRFLTNASSGKMGFALAAEAVSLGAKVTVVSGPTEAVAPRGVAVVRIVTGLQMYRATLARRGASDVIIGAAAVSDWRFLHSAKQKIKRTARDVRLTLRPNPDIIKEVARRRKPGQVVVGFALETRNAVASARGKLRRKGLDMVVANGPASLSAERTRATLVLRDGSVRSVRAGTKRDVARKILQVIESLCREKN